MYNEDEEIYVDDALRESQKNKKIATIILNYFLEKGYSIESIQGIASQFQTMAIDYSAMHKKGRV